MTTPRSPRNNQEQDELTELMGVQNWEEVVEWLNGKTVDEIKAELDNCWPQEEDNDQFAQRLHNELN